MFELMHYAGCGCCPLAGSGKCHGTVHPVKIEFVRNEKWEDCGHFCTVFEKGERVCADAVIDDNKVYCVSAESSLYPGISDFITLENIVIVED